MTTYDDRPISMYDNLNVSNGSGSLAVSAMHTSTPKTKAPEQATSSYTMPANIDSTTTKSGAATQHSPYTEIQFRFNNNNNNKPETSTSSQLLLPNGNQSMHSNNSNNNVSTIPSNTPYYSTPMKKANKIPNSTTTATDLPTFTSHQTTHTPNNSSSSNNSSSNSPAQRPLSQHSQSELNDTCQSIAAVKAALNDAKSKFFGLNGYATENNGPYYNIEPQQTQTAQPKYQNIPENSAIFRQQQQQQQPPELPPKPNIGDFNKSKSNSPSLSSTSSPISARNSEEPSISIHRMPVPSNSHSYNYPSSSSATSKLLPNASYKPIPLNDMDTTHPSQVCKFKQIYYQNCSLLP